MKRRTLSIIRSSTDGLGRPARVRRVLSAVLVLNLLVVVVKLVVWRWTGALSIAAEATHSALDALNNVIALLFARVAVRAPDEDHPWGHEKFETLGALVVVGFLSITVFELVKGATRRLFAATPPPIETPSAAFLLLGGTALLGVGVSWYESREGRRVGSELLLADAAHTRADVLGTIAVLGGLLVVRAGFPVADPLVTLVIAGFIGYSGWGIVKRSVPLLVDERAMESQEIRRVADETVGVFRSYSIRSRGRPGEMLVELTIAVQASLDVEQAHAIADEVERRVTDLLGAREVIVHIEPAQ